MDLSISQSHRRDLLSFLVKWKEEVLSYVQDRSRWATDEAIPREMLELNPLC